MELDKTGFVIIDSTNQPFWIKLMHGKPAMLKWAFKLNKWVTAGKLDESKISELAQVAIPNDSAMVYHEEHIHSTGVNPLNF